MEKLNVAQTISKLLKKHIDKKRGQILGQCLTAVGWVQNTIPPQKKGVIELSMTDTAGAGIAVGAAVAGSRPIYVMRFQSFVWLNSSPIVNHAAISKEIFGYGCPIFIRAIASESSGGQGPLHANNFHSPFAHIPTLNVCAPMTPNEYKKIWKFFNDNNNPLFVSEHRRSYISNIEIKNIYKKKSEATIIAISASRFNALEAQKELNKTGIKTSLINVLWLNPFNLSKKEIETIKKSKIAIVIDSSYEHCGITTSIAYKVQKLTKTNTFVLGLENRIPGVSKSYENQTPSKNKIISKIKYLLKKN